MEEGNYTKTLLLDISNIAYATYWGMQNNQELKTNEDKFEYWRFLMLNAIKKAKLAHQPTEFIICVDSASWRKKVFPYYKAKRDEMKQKMDFDFKFFVEKMDSFYKELDENFHFKLVKYKGAEADDIIAVLAKELAPQRTTIVIASNDKDFKQLLRDKNIHLWNIREEKFVQVDDPKKFLICHILEGDDGDGIPSVVNDDDAFIRESYVQSGTFIKWAKKQDVDDLDALKSRDIQEYNHLVMKYNKETGKEAIIKERQKPCGPKLIEKILEEGLQEYIEREGLKRNFARNRKLVELSKNYIPETIWNGIMETYNSLPVKEKSYNKVILYLGKHKLKSLMEEAKLFL